MKKIFFIILIISLFCPKQNKTVDSDKVLKGTGLIMSLIFSSLNIVQAKNIYDLLKMTFAGHITLKDGSILNMKDLKSKFILFSEQAFMSMFLGIVSIMKNNPTTVKKIAARLGIGVSVLFSVVNLVGFFRFFNFYVTENQSYVPLSESSLSLDYIKRELIMFLSNAIPSTLLGIISYKSLKSS